MILAVLCTQMFHSKRQMMKPTIKIFPRTDFYKKDGFCGIYLRLTINRKKRYYSLDISLPDPEKYWDSQKCQIRRYPKANLLHLSQDNLKLENYSNRASGIILDYNIAKKALTFEDFDRIFKAKGDIKTSFFDFTMHEIENMKEKKVSNETIRSYTSYVSKLKTYRATLNFSEITLEFVKKYHSYMINKLDNGPNTCHKSLSFIRTMLYRAMDQGIIDENIFHRKYPLKKFQGNREFLTITELRRLEMLFENVTLKNYQENVLRYFLFCCYCGLRYQDIKDLRFSDLKKEIHGNKENVLIRVKMHKTKDPVSIPLPKKAIDLIGEGFQNQKVFRVNSNQTTNRYIKESIEICGVKKKITFHSSRHTFATTLITTGVSMAVISELLGHNDLKTTKVYAKIVDSSRIDAVCAFDQF